MPSAFLSPRWSTPSVIVASLLVALGGFLVARQVRNISRDTTNGATVHANPANLSVDDQPVVETADKGSWNERWRDLSKEPSCPARTRDLEAMLEELARTDPKRALALALAEKNWLVRDKLRNAALRGWGAVAPDAAAEWAMAQPLLGERMQCVTAVLTGAVEQPDEAVRVGLRLCAADASPAGDYGHALINALIEKAGAFDKAAQFAIAAGMVDRQSYLLDSAFYQWAQHEPGQALAELQKITDPALRNAVLKGVTAGWADADAEKLAGYAQAMAEGPERTSMFRIALPEWVKKDPEAALKWMNSVDPDPDYDKGIAALAVSPSLLTNQPEAAMDLTDSIADTADRKLIKSNVFFQWAQRDPTAARKFAETTQNPEYREMLLDDWAAATRPDR